MRQDPTLQRFITVPGVGPVTALAFLSVIYTPERFKHARDFGPPPDDSAYERLDL